MMPSVTIDAGILAVPSVSSMPSEAHRYVDTILDWRRLLDEPWAAIYMSERAAEALFEDGLYPLRDQLRQLFTAQGIVEYDVNTVAQVVDTLLQLTPHFETYFGVRDVLADNVVTNPDILHVCAGPALRSDLARCVVLIAILREHCRGLARNHSLILRQAPGSGVNVRALIHYLEHDRNDLIGLPSPPDVFEGNVLVCDNFRTLIGSLDEAAIILSCSDDIGLETAIRIALYKSRLQRSEEPDWDDTNGLFIGRCFGNILSRCCQGQPAVFAFKVLRAVVETLEGFNMPAVHPLRTGPGGNDPQRTRGKDKAWRREIDGEFRLHYWQCEDGRIEFASVCVHKDFSIPE